MQQGCLVAELRHGAIVLVVFGQVGLGINKIRNSELVGVKKNSIVGWKMELLSSGNTSCIISSSLMCHAWSDMVVDLVGDFRSTRHILSHRRSLNNWLKT